MAGLACAIWRDRAGAGRGMAQTPRAGTGSRRERSSLSPLKEASLRGGDSPHPSCHLEQNWGEPTTEPGGPTAWWKKVIVFTQIYEWVVRAKDDSQLPSCTARRQQAAYHQRYCVAEIGIKQAGKHTTHWADTYTATHAFFTNTHTQTQMDTAGTVTVGTHNLGTSWGKFVNEEG